MLKVNGLEITARSTKERLVKGISFEVGKGETLGLIGESGSGKSLTSKAVMGLLNRRIFKVNGSIKWNGQEMLVRTARMPKGYRGQQIAMITQNPMTAFAPMIKLGKQIEMGFELKSRNAKQTFYEQLDSALKSVNLSDMKKILSSYPDELSGGMLQRVMIAITLLKKPELISADECTTAVDAASEYMILNRLEEQRKKGMSMIVITHDFGVAARLCDRVAVMRSGSIIEQGKTLDVFRSPQSEYTHELAAASVLFREGVC
ncbi:MAG: ABC transporter ATP-binding protein [Oscillospiraceae bacterium]|nr:ABC transporter ATP-binding protein [Oscillospiraceae bacterium]